MLFSEIKIFRTKLINLHITKKISVNIYSKKRKHQKHIDPEVIFQILSSYLPLPQTPDDLVAAHG